MFTLASNKTTTMMRMILISRGRNCTELCSTGQSCVAAAVIDYDCGAVKRPDKLLGGN